jgi:hypothetical protein
VLNRFVAGSMRSSVFPRVAQTDPADLFVMSADGTDIRPLTRSPNWDGSPDWGSRP